ncbi:MAG: copper resistance system multicopper oxidase [Sphingobium sp.]|jgi:copper-resistance protein, CopA family|uniref:copper resistance system multicopper oxidase n=1 Tax=Sphingobium TaxID=165695 RepID=UPI0017ACDF16|nr:MULTISPECIES: copper resistance system multicopper oxidase [Sphingobium]MBA4756547.1 copper resistance system multicopper oxidase [Sphingobium sp.]MCE7798089.1 copper resistance system multicopper oxidase [Sphingobium sufflavum]
MTQTIGRRSLLRAGVVGAAGLGFSSLFPAWAQTGSMGQMPTLSGEDIHLKIANTPFTVGGRNGHAVTMNGVLPAPLIRLREGQNVRLHVENTLNEDSSIHWHGLIVPFQMDGVPGVSFPGIKPHTTFVYEFPLLQSGTYWYHSHSGLQEQQGHYGPIVIDPAEPDPVAYDREHVIVLSDWTFLHPHQLVTKLKAEGGYFNRQRQTLFGMLSGGPEESMSASDRAMWGKMRMDPTDIADVTAATYTYLVNGHGPQENWTGLFRPGERVRLRFINAATMTIFNIRIPGLPMTVVSADGLNVRPVTVDEFQIGNAETYDVIIRPAEDKAFTLVAESIDRSGMARATLAPRMGMTAPVPPLRPRPTLTMKDMGMGGMDHGSMAGMDHGAMAAGASTAAADDGGSHSMGSMNMRDKSLVPDSVKVGVGVDAIAMSPVDRTADPGVGLEDVGHKVLTYRDLMSLTSNPDTRPPQRTIEVHLTGNMERFMWSFDGEKFSEGVEPIRFERNERARVVLINDTMMTHPIHLHGHFFDLVNGHTGSYPRKHTVNVLPGGKVSFDLTADAPGDWAFHCHLLLHMHAGMFRVVTVRPLEGEAA